MDRVDAWIAALDPKCLKTTGIVVSVAALLLGALLISHGMSSSQGSASARLRKPSPPPAPPAPPPPVSKHDCSQSRDWPWRSFLEADLQGLPESMDRSAITDSIAHLERRNDTAWHVLVHKGVMYARPLNTTLVKESKRVNSTLAGDITEFLMPLLRAMCYGPTWPDVEFIWRIGGEWNNDGASGTLATLSWAKEYTQNHRDLLVPFIPFNALHGLRSGGMFDQKPWHERKPVALWRGSSTGALYNETNWEHQTRTKLVRICRNNSHLCDARFSATYDHLPQTTPGAEAAMMKEFAPLAPHMHMREYSHYKYLLSVDGNAAATRVLYLLFTGSVLVRQMSPSVEFYYSALQPYVHYMPVAPDLSDLPAVLRWLRAHDKEAQAMAARTLAWAMAHVTEEAVGCHVAALVQGLADREKWTRQVDESWTQWRLRPDADTRGRVNRDVGFHCLGDPSMA